MSPSFVDELSGFALALGEDLSAPLHWAILSNGDADFHDNLIFFGFDDKHTDPILVAKVPRLVENGWMLRTEYDHLAELWRCVGEQAKNYVPKPYAMTTLQQRPVLLLSYLAGESLTRLSPRTFWRNSEQISALAREAGRTLRYLNRLTESPIQGTESRGSDFPPKAAKFRELFSLTPEEDGALSDLIETAASSVARADHRVIVQGDFWHGNMIREERRGNLRLVDWQFARWSADVSVDVYFFLLAGALAATENRAMALRAREAFDLLGSWRSSVIPEYLSAYGKPEHYGLLPEKYGMMLCCVEKAVRSALEFGYSHRDDLLWRSLFAELLHWSDEG